MAMVLVARLAVPWMQYKQKRGKRGNTNHWFFGASSNLFPFGIQEKQTTSDSVLSEVVASSANGL
jgi:hypothetical protein